MLVGVVQKRRLADMASLIARLDPHEFDLLELRLDGCEDLTPEGLAAIPLPLPAIFTLRAVEEGGRHAGDEAGRLLMLEKLAALRPAYLDVESFVPAERIAAIRAISPETRIILSAHNFSDTPDDLDAVLAGMRQKAEGVIYKIATTARNTLEALRMLLFCKQARDQGLDIIGISMGKDGECTRILAPVFHAGFSYCPIEESTAPGQLSARELRTRYGFSRLNAQTAVYGLLGDPVEPSRGHIYHNERNASSGINAVYVKWRLRPEETAEGLRLLAALGVRGCSVTMPLKEVVLPCLASMDESSAIGAINTLKLSNGGYTGVNTDGAGALNALPVSVTDRRVAVIGAGGAAKAVIHELQRKRACVTVFNRTTDKPLPGGIRPRPLSELLEAEAAPYDILINTLPFDAPVDFSRLPLEEGMVAYDISYAKASRFLELARAAGCRVLDGSGMFEAQAELQRRFWGLP